MKRCHKKTKVSEEAERGATTSIVLDASERTAATREVRRKKVSLFDAQSADAVDAPPTSSGATEATAQEPHRSTTAEGGPRLDNGEVGYIGADGFTEAPRVPEQSLDEEMALQCLAHAECGVDEIIRRSF